jgi:hypothetical protein
MDVTANLSRMDVELQLIFVETEMSSSSLSLESRSDLMTFRIGYEPELLNDCELDPSFCQSIASASLL